jgi:hypothetical protein
LNQGSRGTKEKKKKEGILLLTSDSRGTDSSIGQEGFVFGSIANKQNFDQKSCGIIYN